MNGLVSGVSLLLGHLGRGQDRRTCRGLCDEHMGARGNFGGLNDGWCLRWQLLSEKISFILAKKIKAQRVTYPALIIFLKIFHNLATVSIDKLQFTGTLRITTSSLFRITTKYSTFTVNLFICHKKGDQILNMLQKQFEMSPKYIQNSGFCFFYSDSAHCHVIQILCRKKIENNNNSE